MVVQWAHPRTAPECGRSAAVSRRPTALRGRVRMRPGWRNGWKKIGRPAPAT